MSKALLAYEAEEQYLLGLIDARDSIADKQSPEWGGADTAIDMYLAQLPLESRVDRVTRVLRLLESQREAAKVEVDRLTAWRRAAEAAINDIKRRAENFLVAAGMVKAVGRTSSLRLTANPEKVVIHDEALVPNDLREITVTFVYANWLNIVDIAPALAGRFLRITKPEPRRSLIKLALESGEGVPGCSIEQAFRVEVK